MGTTPPLYKVLVRHDGRLHSCHGGSGQWRPGRWRAVRGDLKPCDTGLHLCRARDLPEWLREDAEVWEAEGAGDEVTCRDKMVYRRARVTSRVGILSARTLRLFAADCAERALLRERKAGRKPDARSWAAVQAARDYAEGRIDRTALRAAAAAAYDAYAAAAAAYAAYDAAYAAAYDAYAAADAAHAAADAAARAAADALADAVAAAYDDAEREWQGARLLAYLRGETPPPVEAP